MARFDARLFGLLTALFLFLSLFAPGAMAARYNVLHQFCAHANQCTDGFDLQGPLVRDAAGNLYGTASGGGAHGGGTIFRLQPQAHGKWTFDVLHDFCAEDDCADGLAPAGALIVDRDGNLYGVALANTNTEYGDSVVYRLRPDGAQWDYDILYELCSDGVCDGAFARAGLAYAGQSTGAAYDGVSPLFGTASSLGANDGGMAFMLVPKNGQWQHSVIYDFCAKHFCADGGNPIQPFIVQDAHHLVGVVAQGGPNRAGAVIRLSSEDGKAWKESVVHSFCSLAHCADGGPHPSSLSTDAAGNLYGTTETGGKCAHDFKCGTIFRIAPDDTESVIFEFCRRVGGCKVGTDPGAGVAVGTDGTLYGTTRAGGTADAGVIFAFDGNRMKLLHSFCDGGCEFGGNSLSPMIIDPAGHLFGVTPEGDRGGGGGVVYELVP